MTHTHEWCWDWFKQRQICGVSYGAVQISMQILDTGAIKIHGLLLLLLKLTNYIGILLTNKWTVQSIFIFRVSVFSLASIAIFYSGILQGKFEVRDKNKFPKKILSVRPQPIGNLLFMISRSIYLPFFVDPTYFSIDLKIGWISWKKISNTFSWAENRLQLIFQATDERIQLTFLSLCTSKDSV